MTESESERVYSDVVQHLQAALAGIDRLVELNATEHLRCLKAVREAVIEAIWNRLLDGLDERLRAMGARPLDERTTEKE